MSKNTLCLSSSSESVTREVIDLVPTPPPGVGKRPHVPLAHGDFIDAVLGALDGTGLKVVEQTYALANSGARLFGLLTLDGDKGGGGDYATTIGLRNSHDKSFAVGCSLGSRVLVCDNLAFSADVVLQSKHTKHIRQRLNGIVVDGISRLISRKTLQDERINAYKGRIVRDTPHLHDIVLRGFRAKALPATAIPHVLHEFENPSHECFANNSLWSLFNSCTEVLKRYAPTEGYSSRLHNVFDVEVAPLLLSA